MILRPVMVPVKIPFLTHSTSRWMRIDGKEGVTRHNDADRNLAIKFWVKLPKSLFCVPPVISDNMVTLQCDLLFVL